MSDGTFKPMQLGNVKSNTTFTEMTFRQEVKMPIDLPVTQSVEQVPMIDPNELEAIKNNAYDEAYQKGFEKALQDVQFQKDQLVSLAQLMLSPVAFVEQTVQNEVIQLAAWIAKAILKTELTINPKKILVIFKEIDEILPNLNQIKYLFLSSNDYQIFHQYFEQGSKDLSMDCLQIDPSLSQGEYRLELKETEVDASVEARVQELVFKALESEGAINE